MRMLELRLRATSLVAVLGLTLVPATAAAARVPQPRELEAALRRLDLPRGEGPGTISHNRSPLYFPVTRQHGDWQTADNMFRVAVRGHGHSARRYQSVSMEMHFWSTGSFEAGLATAERVMTTMGLPDEVRATAVAMIRAARDRRPDQDRYETVTREAREAVGIQVLIRARFTGGGLVFLHFTDADAPEARWPTRDDVERLHPHTHRRILNVPADVAVFQDPVVTSLRCRPAGHNAFRCRYLLDNSRVDGRPVDRYTGLFRRHPYGEWAVTIEQPRIRAQDPPTLIWKAREQ